MLYTICDMLYTICYTLYAIHYMLLFVTKYKKGLMLFFMYSHNGK